MEAYPGGLAHNPGPAYGSQTHASRCMFPVHLQARSRTARMDVITIWGIVPTEVS
jgi:hypothetical protein